MNQGTKQQLDEEAQWRQRIENTINEIRDRQSDDMQIRANVSYIFQPGSVWEQYASKVTSHDTDINRAKGAVMFIGAGTVLILWKALQDWFHRS